MTTEQIIEQLDAVLRDQDATLAMVAEVGGWVHVSPYEDADADLAA